MSVTDWAKKLDLTVEYIWDLERGKYSPSANVLSVMTRGTDNGVMIKGGLVTLIFNGRILKQQEYEEMKPNIIQERGTYGK
jgi:hypothetical protein